MLRWNTLCHARGEGLVGVYKLITAPVEEPIILEAAKAHLRVDHSTDDLLIDSLITAVRQYTEEITGRLLITQTQELLLDSFPKLDVIKLWRLPLQSVTSVKYTDDQGVESTYAASNYLVDINSVPARITLKATSRWPTDTLQVTNGVAVQCKFGYGDPEDVPEAIKQALLLRIAYLYENREDAAERPPVALPFAYDALLAPYRVWTFA